MDNIETRDIELRFNEEERTITGLAVPYGEDANIGGAYKERFVRGSISEDVSDVKLFYGHEEPIGKVIEGRETDAGFEIVAKISDTVRGNEVRTLLQDGVLNKFSVGFVPLESERDGSTVIRTSVSLREVSVVPFPAYAGATIQEVREDETTTNAKEIPMESEKNIEFEVQSVQEDVAELRRLVEAGHTVASNEPTVDTRSAGEVLKAIAKGDDEAIRAYTGGTTADAVVKNGWVGDLTRIVDEAAVLRGVFGTATLPSEGNYIEYAQLKTNGIDVDVQSAEGDDLAFGLIEQELKTAPVKTLGGYSTLSRQEIERSSVNILDATLRAQAIQVGKALNAQMRTAYTTAHAAQVTASNVVVIPATPTYSDWLDAIVEAAVKFETLGLSIDALVVDKATFKALSALEGADGRPVLLVQGNGVNNVGTIDVRGLAGSLASIPVVLDAGLTDQVAFVNSAAIRMYNSPVVRLQDENIINLSKDFSVYTYVATANEIPAAIVPVVVD